MSASLSFSNSRLHALTTALERAAIGFHSLIRLPSTGLAHDHIWIKRKGGDWVARLPKQSQMNLPPQANLAYQAACYERTSLGGHTPRLHQILPPSAELPRGGLLVDAIHGRPAQLPQDLPAIATALASLHRLPLPPVAQRPPLLAPADPWGAMRAEIQQQSRWLAQSGLPDYIQQTLTQTLTALPEQLPPTHTAQACLISFDTHPGNFLITPTGQAILVDLEKCRYGLPGFDLAHATLYTSTTWDVHSQARLSIDEVTQFYHVWQEAIGDQVDIDTLLLCRQAMCLWSLTWCAKWRAIHQQARDTHQQGEDWAAELSDPSLVSHVRERVEHYLSPLILAWVLGEHRLLRQQL